MYNYVILYSSVSNICRPTQPLCIHCVTKSCYYSECRESHYKRYIKELSRTSVSSTMFLRDSAWGIVVWCSRSLCPDAIPYTHSAVQPRTLVQHFKCEHENEKYRRHSNTCTCTSILVDLAS